MLPPKNEEAEWQIPNQLFKWIYICAHLNPLPIVCTPKKQQNTSFHEHFLFVMMSKVENTEYDLKSL